MDEFKFGMKFELYYWYKDAAFCFAMAPYISAVKFALLSAFKFEQCSRVVIKCIDNWDAWKDENELLLGTCSLSSSEDVTVWQFNPIDADFEHYMIGAKTYVKNFCFPGPTPLYSPWMKYPNNFFYANWDATKQLTNIFKVAYAGLPSYNPAFDGPVVRSSWEEIYNNMSKAIAKDIHNWVGF